MKRAHLLGIEYFKSLFYQIEIILGLTKKNELYPVYLLAFTGLSGSAKYLPTETEIKRMNGGAELPNHDDGEIEIKNVTKEIENDEDEVSNVEIKRRSILVWLISTAVILIFASSTVYFHIRNSETDKIYKKYFNAPVLAPAIFSNPDFAENLNWRNSLQAYTEKNYGLALSYFNTMNEATPDYEISKFLRSICLMQESRFSDALVNFNEISKNSILNQNVNWYTGLCYLKLGNIKASKVVFQELSREKGLFFKKADEILYKIDAVH